MREWRVIVSSLWIMRKRQSMLRYFSAIVIILLLMVLLSSCGRVTGPVEQEGDVLDVSETAPERESLGELESIPQEQEAEMIFDAADYDTEEAQKTISEIRTYARNGNLLRRTLYAYDELGHMTVKEQYYMDNENAESREEYVYDEQGKLISMCNYRDGGVLRYREEYVYDERGLLEAVQSYSEGTEDMFLEKLTYDDFGNKLSERGYDSDGRLRNRAEYEYAYDGQGNILTMHVYRPGATGCNVLYKYDYDDDGRISEEREYSLEEEALVLTEQGFVATDVKTDNNGILLWRWEYDYDEQGNILEKRKYRSDGEIEGYFEYVY